MKKTQCAHPPHDLIYVLINKYICIYMYIYTCIYIYYILLYILYLCNALTYSYMYIYKVLKSAQCPDLSQHQCINN